MNSYFNHTSFIAAQNMQFIENLYSEYRKNPSNVDKTWHRFFKLLSTGESNIASEETINLQVGLLINAYRRRGYLLANLDPLSISKIPSKEELKLSLNNFGLTGSLKVDIEKANNFLENQETTIDDIVGSLEKIYSDKIAVEFAHVTNIEEQDWLYKNYEASFTNTLTNKDQILSWIISIEEFEQFLHIKFPGVKRFSASGAEASIVTLIHLINNATDYNINEIIISMAHRARISTLAEAFKKPYEIIFQEFKATVPKYIIEQNFSGDVKYHLGYSSITDDNVKLTLLSNPSHLESINSVLSGVVKSKQDESDNPSSILGIMIHGDASFIGQGVVSETLVMSRLPAYNTNGTIHIIIDNQIGFTAEAKETRPNKFSSDIAKSIEAPIIHVNGDSVEEAIKAISFAIKYRQEFSKDIVINIICYRKYGHNEGDEPFYTQPQMYQAIRKKEKISDIYNKFLVKNNLINDNLANELRGKVKNKLSKALENISNVSVEKESSEEGKYIKSDSIITGIDRNTLHKIGRSICEVKENFALHPKLDKLLAQRKKLLEQEKIDWATAEQLAFASLLIEGNNIRLSGQDSCRGTFSHRHSILHSQDSEDSYIALNNLSEKQGYYHVSNSYLSEYAALGFEYGYSLNTKSYLIIWEAQFGDFANGAQIIFDQYISSAYAKWQENSSLTILLPHGYEGQGPEHSSARIERFLQLAAENNMQIAVPTTPASYFHLLRKQIAAPYKLPLIVMTPKSLLRHKMAISNLSELASDTSFIPVIDDNVSNKESVREIILCTGKIYYELLAKRDNIKNIAIIRIEQLYPWPEEELSNIMNSYKYVNNIIWCQEEPCNMGAWSFVSNKIKNLHYTGRKESASPATGYLSIHNKEQEQLIDRAINFQKI